MIRRMFVMTLLAMPMSVLALGLGDINVRSGLNQPLEAEIPLLSVASDEIDTLNVGLASPEAFEQAGVERPFHLTQLRFKVEQKGGKPYIHAYSQEPIKEPYLQYLLEVNWRGGRLVKEFTVLLDPPTLAEIAPPPIRAPKAAVATPAPVTPAEPAPSPVQEAPIEISPPAAVAPESTIPPVSGSRASEPREDYTVKPGETLWSIAQRLKPDDTVSAQQIMLAILKQNPDAFLNKNVNTLKAHAVLTIPDFDAIIALTKDEAKGIVKEHNAGWRSSNQKPAAAEAKPAEPQIESAPQQESGAKLKLVAPAEEVKPAPPAAVAGTPANGSPSPPAATSTQPPATATTASPSATVSTPPPSAATPNAASTTDTTAMQAAELDRVHKELTLANEAVEARRQENDELRSRLAALEEQTASTQRLIKLKDEELATLQAKMKEIEQGRQSSATKTAANAGSGAEKPQLAADAAGESSLEAMWSALIGNPLGQGMVAAVGLLLVSMLWLIKRRHEANTFVAEERVEPRVAAQTFTTEAPALAVIAPAPEVTDPLDEAEAYIHHQRYAEAETVLRQAIANEPERNELRLKLLEVYSRTKDVEAFTSQARDLHDHLRGHDGPLWDKVLAMGKELDPNEPLFGGQTPVVTSMAGATGFAANETLEVPPSPPPAVETGGSWLDREHTGHVIEFDQTSLTPPAVEQAASAASQPEPNLLEGSPAQTEASPLQPFEPQPSSEQTPTWSFDTAQDKGRDYPLDLDLEKEAERLADAGAESAPLPDVDRPSYLESDDLTAEDEVATKLDLARAYMDMGDPDGAQGILDEVMKEGNEPQRREAEELLRKIG
ncbi:MAG: FimV family protein [Gammaproteobacteria bacterium]|nr:FimV family protein [Gammaproteobacteria bacterium]